MLAILSSVPFESDQILACLKNVRKFRIAAKTACRGKISGSEIILINSGIGKVNAALAAALITERYRIHKIINAGIGGAYPGSGLNAGDIAVAIKETYGDEGVITSRGWGSLKNIGIPLVQNRKIRFFNEFPLDRKLSAKIIKLIAKSSSSVSAVKSGNFVTVSAVSGTGRRAKELEKRFGAICENMEGAAIAQVCAIYNIPMIEIRGISNIAGVREKRKWNIKLASENCQKVVIKAIKNIINH